jgi:HD superfamily phosphodiesterase
LLACHEDEAAEIDVPDAGILLDMDVPSDYARLAAAARLPSAPTVAECEAILAAHETAERVRRHSRAVAAVAQALALRLPRVDLDVVIAASLLHDMVRERPDHAQAAAMIIAAFGYPAVAAAMAHHMDLAFAGNADAAAVVFLADKLVREDRRVSLQERFAPAFARFAGQPEALAGATRRYDSARAVAAAIEAQSGATVDELLAGCGVPA